MLTQVGLVKNLSQSEQMILVVLKGMSFERARIFTKSKHLQCKPALILKVAFFRKCDVFKFPANNSEQQIQISSSGK